MARVRSKADICNVDYQSDCEFFTDVLLKNDVPASEIIGEDKSGHTCDNAFLSRKIIDERGINIESALIVCKAFMLDGVLCYTRWLFLM